MVYIQFEKSTNLGNWLFQILYAREIALRYGHVGIAYLVSSENDEARIRAYEELYPGVGIAYYLPDGCKFYDCNTSAYYSINTFAGHENILIRGLFQHYSYFDRDKVLEYLKCPYETETKIESRYSEILKAEGSVGISVRRGDYLRYPQMHPFVGTGYLQRAVEKFPKSAIFVVCSDDILWCKRFFGGKAFSGRKFVFVEGEDVLTQLFIHTRCNHNIISNSTFSWWGAYLNGYKGQRTIFPSMWFGLSARYQPYGMLYWQDVEVISNGYSMPLLIHAIINIAKEYCGKCFRAIVSHFRR